MKEINQFSKWQFYKHPCFLAIIDAVVVFSGWFFLVVEKGSPNFFSGNFLFFIAVIGLILFVFHVTVSVRNKNTGKRWGKQFDLEAISLIARNILISTKNDEDNNSEGSGELRVCLVQRISEQKYKRVTTYTNGDQKKGHGGQRISTSLGIVGWAIRTDLMGALTVNAQSIEKREEILRKGFGYEKQSLNGMRDDALSWACATIGVPSDKDDFPNEVRFVIFCDSSDPDFFGDKNSNRMKKLEEFSVHAAACLKNIEKG